MNYNEMIGRVKELAGGRISSDQAAEILKEAIKMSGIEAPVEYPSCRHTSKEMLEHYGKTGSCGICIDERNRRLEGSIKTASAGAAAGSLMVGALAGHAMANRFLGILKRHGVCADCGRGLLEGRIHGCVTCREDRSWLTRITKRTKSKR